MLTFARTQRGYILPATHYASSSTDPDRPPMGLRLRLKAAYDLSGFHGQSIMSRVKAWLDSNEASASFDDEIGRFVVGNVRGKVPLMFPRPKVPFPGWKGPLPDPGISKASRPSGK